MDLPFHSYAVENASTAGLINCFVETLPQGAKGKFALKRSPGIRSVTGSLGTGRGLHNFNGVLYAVAGTILYRVDSNNATTSVGTIPGKTLVFMASNTNQMALSHDGEMSVLEGSLSPVTDNDRPIPCGAIDYLDSYLIAVHEGTGQFQCSNLADYTDYDALDFATAESQPDNLISIKASHSSALLFGDRSTEIWDNQGGSGFPFVRNVNGVVELGIIGKYAVTSLDNSVFWVANDLTLRRLNGNTPVRVSQHGAEAQWRKYSTTSDAVLTNYTFDGHLCVVVDFPTQGKTWVYDVTTQEMHEREGERYLGWDVADVCRCYERVYVQRRSTGEIAIMDADTFDQWGQMLRTEWAYQPIYDAGSRITVNNLRLGISTGLGNSSVENPQITMELSKEGGRAGTFRAWPTRSLGEQGRFKTRVDWPRLGEMREGVIRMSISDAVPLTVWDTTVT